MGRERSGGVVLLTGASGGFGRIFARRLEQAGHNLVLSGRDHERLAACRQQLDRPQAHRIVAADLSTQEGIDALLDATTSSEAPVCGLVNNAGFGLWGPFERRTSCDHRALIATDLIAPMALTHALLPQLRRQHGFIINVSSLAGESPLPWMGSYSAAKAGLTSWSEALRAELAGAVRVVTLAPGPSPTGFRSVSGMPDRLGGRLRTPPERVVDAALATLARGGGFSVPGWRHRLLWLLQKSTPRPLSCAVMRRYLAP
ncbi:MAG: SDR family NAD(P)-dependent oxidoreductase [Zetaproteobacteria bacterium]|nr:MAG: SDR family NAD(P)-dependent oxidoreductase [Zetaproteobacteria bacterium]